MRSAAQAGTAYAADHNEWQGRDGMGGWEAFTFLLISHYMDEPRAPQSAHHNVAEAMDFLRPIEPYKCPSVTAPEYVLHYVVNSCDFRHYGRTGNHRELNDTRGFAPLTWLDRHSSTLFIVEVNMSTLPHDRLGGYNVWRPGDLPFDDMGEPRTSGNRMISADDHRHGGVTMAAMFDGSARSMPLDPEHWRRGMINGTTE